MQLSPNDKGVRDSLEEGPNGGLTRRKPRPVHYPIPEPLPVRARLSRCTAVGCYNTSRQRGYANRL